MQENRSPKLPLSQLIIIVLSVYVLISLLVSTFVTVSSEIDKLLNYIDTAICGVFLADFIYRFIKAESKLTFMKWGWIDLISSIPTFDYLRAGRALRLVRLLRILRAFRSTKVLLNYVFRKKTHGVMTTAAIIAILMIIFSSIAILQVEKASNSNITTAEDALWWSYVTITTVGYGDKFPVTTEGRIIAVTLMTVGVGLFGIFAGFIASWFVQNKAEATDADQYIE